MTYGACSRLTYGGFRVLTSLLACVGASKAGRWQAGTRERGGAHRGVEW